MPLLGVSGGDVLCELRAAAAELLVLGAEAALCGLLWASVRSSQRTIDRLREAPLLDLQQPLSHQLPPSCGGVFCGVRGAVQPAAASHVLPSRWRPELSGVIRRETFQQLSDSRAAAGFWSRRLRLLHDATSSVPFQLVAAGPAAGAAPSVQVTDVERLWRVDLTTVHDQFEPAVEASSPAQWLWQWVAGEHARGVQKTEKLLLTDTPVIGYGLLSRLPATASCQQLQLQLAPPDGGWPYLISCEERPALLARLAGERNAAWWAATALTVAGLLFGGWVAWRVGQGVLQRRRRRRLLLEWDEIRAMRRRRARDSAAPVPESVLCVVCLSNPRELVLSPCQHVCMCVDCEEQLTRRVCPVCREQVETVRPVYIS